MSKVKYTIETARKKMLLTQKEFADLIGVSQTIVSMWETGRSSPSLSNKRKILEVTGLKVKDFKDDFLCL